MAALAGLPRLLDDLPVAVALVDEAGVIRHVNPAAVRRYGWRNEAQAVGLSAAVLGEGLPERLASAPWRGELPATGAGSGTFVAAFEVARQHDDDGNEVGFVVVCSDASRRAEAELAAERLARLQALTARLGGARTVDEVAAVVCDHAAAGGGAQGVTFMRLVEDDDAFEIVRQLGLPAGVVDEFRRFPLDASLPAGDAVRAGSLVLIDGQDDRDRRYPALRGQPMVHEGHVMVPMVYDDRPVGVIAFGFRRVREMSDDDRRFLLAVAAQAAQAVDRARVDETERQARRRPELLARATGLLAGSLDHEASIAAVGRLVVQDLADSFSVHLREDGELRTAAVVHADPDVEATMRSMVATPVGIAAVRYLEHLAGRSVLSPEIRPEWWQKRLGEPNGGALAALDLASGVVVPLRSRGQQLGVVVATRGSERDPFDHDAFALLTELASRLAATIEAALAHRARAEVARTLQASLLPPRLPAFEGVRLASRYDPIGDGSLVGGDFYDVFRALDRWVLVLGDVCGQGVPAASLTAEVRYTIRAAARMWHSPAEILRFANDAIIDHDIGERFCTALLAVLEPDADGLYVTLATAGHHLPLHVPAGGEPVPVGRMGTALGLVRHPEVWDEQFRLDVGDLLVLTTDGVIEARGADGDLVGERFLEELVEANAGEGAEAVAGAIERAVLAAGGGRAHDDVAVLVVEAAGSVVPGEPVGPPPSGAEPFDRRYPAATTSVTDARRDLYAWLEAHGTGGPRVPDLLLALTELATNAVRAARTAVEVRCWLAPDAVMLEVTDDGPGFDASIPRSSRDLDPLAERGRGLFLVAALVDECTIESGPNGTIVRCYVAR